MAALSSQARLIIGDENFEVRQKKVAFDGKTKNSKVAAKKGREGVVGARKPLGDLTNKKGIHVEAAAVKPIAPQDKFNIAEECFLHDHSKCAEAKYAGLELSFLDLVLPKCDMVFTDRKDSIPAKMDLDSSPFLEELEIPDLSQWDSPPPLHKCFNSPPSSPFAWQFEPVEFALKEEN